ncbi:MAG TPA: hypothetical protein VJH90_02635 [archaeon]|nr:hypothetical protein [archaeon]
MAVDTGSTVSGFLQRLGFADILLWLLTFAIVYGLLSKAKVPQSKEAQAIIAMVFGFLVLFAVPSAVVGYISQLSTGLVLVLLGLLVFIVLMEALGFKLKKVLPVFDEKTGKKIGATEKEMSVFEAHPYVFGAAFLIIIALLFVSSGGLSILGIKIPTGFDITGTAVIIAVILAVLWILFKGE